MRELGILVVDNNLEILLLIERLFSYFKIRVDSFTSADAALEKLLSCDYKIMISDLDMQESTGLELARKAHQINPDLNIVLFIGDRAEQILNLILEPKVSDISGTTLKECTVESMLLDIKNRKTGKIFLLD
jgi:CheY-like chemotaxis protein